MSKLIAVIQQLQSKLERFRADGLKETPTRTIFVDPLLDALGWDVRDPDEVQLEYPTIDGKSVDYALKLNRKAVLLVEAKGMNDSLGDVKDITQTTGYAANDGIVWCILTNGVRWRVYSSMEKCPAPEKLMFEVSFHPKDLEGVSLEQVAQKFQRFSRDSMARGVLDSLGEQTFTDGKIRKAMQRMMAEPPSALLKLIRKTVNDSSLKPQAIRESLGRIMLPVLGAGSPSPQVGKIRDESKRSHGARKAWATRRKIENYDEHVHTDGKPREVLDLYQRLDQFCLGLRPGTVEKKYLLKYLAYRNGKRTFCSAWLGREALKVWVKLRFEDLQNPPPFARDVASIGHWGVGDVELVITNVQHLIEAQGLIKDSFERT